MENLLRKTTINTRRKQLWGDKFRKSSTESMFGKQPGGKQHEMQITKTKKQKTFL